MSTRRGSGERILRPGTAVVLGRDGGPLVFRPGGRARYDDPVTVPRRRVASLLRSVAAIGLTCALAACSSTVSPSPSARPSASSRPSAAAPSLTPVPGGRSPTPAPSLPTTSQTEFGRIWDAVPKTFPKLTGQSESEIGTAASGQFVVNGEVPGLVQEMRTDLTELGWTVDVGSPLEDGSVVIEARGTATGCTAEVRFEPHSGTVALTVLYGASCPFS